MNARTFLLLLLSLCLTSNPTNAMHETGENINPNEGPSPINIVTMLDSLSANESEESESEDEELSSIPNEEEEEEETTIEDYVNAYCNIDLEQYSYDETCLNLMNDYRAQLGEPFTNGIDIDELLQYLVIALKTKTQPLELLEPLALLVLTHGYTEPKTQSSFLDLVNILAKNNYQLATAPLVHLASNYCRSTDSDIRFFGGKILYLLVENLCTEAVAPFIKHTGITNITEDLIATLKDFRDNNIINKDCLDAIYDYITIACSEPNSKSITHGLTDTRWIKSTEMHIAWHQQYIMAKCLIAIFTFFKKGTSRKAKEYACSIALKAATYYVNESHLADFRKQYQYGMLVLIQKLMCAVLRYSHYAQNTEAIPQVNALINTLIHKIQGLSNPFSESGFIGLDAQQQAIITEVFNSFDKAISSTSNNTNHQPTSMHSKRSHNDSDDDDHSDDEIIRQPKRMTMVTRK